MMLYQTTKIYRAHLITDNSIVVVFDWGAPVTILRENGYYDAIRQTIECGEYSALADMVDKATRLSLATKGKFTVQNGSVVIDGEALPSALSRRIIDAVDNNEDTSRLEAFWNNLSKNPTESARQDLFSFLEANCVPITRDGCFIVYKKVRDNFWDSHTGETFHCVPGYIVSMPRDSVDHNREHTCSAGLHVAAFEYAQGFSGSRLVECKVSPADVVAVPPDYSHQKMRVCRAQILRETSEKYTENVYEEDESDEALVSSSFTPLELTCDSEGRLRIPSHAVRFIGVGVGHSVEVVIEDITDTFFTIRPLGAIKDETEDDYYSYVSYMASKDNSFKISPMFLNSLPFANGETSFVLEEFQGFLRLFPLS